MKRTTRKMMRAPIENIKDLPVRQAAPNMVTMLALACGVSTLNFAFWGRWDWAVASIALAAIFDGLDGRIARSLNVSSRFGVELDSLSDLVSFGVAPGFLIYQWTMNPELRSIAIGIGQKDPSAVGVPWLLALFLALCCALRLARFNTMVDDKKPSYWDHFFMGLPAPGGAYMALLPLIGWLATGWKFLRNPWVAGAFLLVSALLMASRVPTPSLKKLHLPKDVVLVIFAGLVAFTFWKVWVAISVVGVLYIAAIPFGLAYFIKQKKLAK